MWYRSYLASPFWKIIKMCGAHLFLLWAREKVGWWLIWKLQWRTPQITTLKHFSGLFVVLLGQKLLKLGQKRAKNQPKYLNLAIKLERKALETPFWYQTKALHEHNLNKLFWQQINICTVSKSPKNTIFGSKIAISWPPSNLNMTTFNIRPTPKIFFDTLHYPY